MISLTTLVLQVIVPLALLGWLATGRTKGRAAWTAEIAAVAVYLIAIALGGLWPLHPWLVPGVYAIALVRVGARRFARVSREPAWPASLRGWLGLGARGALLVSVIALTAVILAGRRAPVATAVDLAFPLANGKYYVANGGNSALINAHLMTLSGERFRPWRGQSYGVDLIELNRWGLRARGLRPRDPEAYAIFGDAVLSPCTGTVVSAVDGLADLAPPQVDRAHMAGNHVILACGDAWVVLGHLKQRSICVDVGDAVTKGQAVGRVGNTGNSDEPHLHIHAQRPGTVDAPLGGAPLVIRFGGRYLVRNARIRGVRAS